MCFLCNASFLSCQQLSERDGTIIPKRELTSLWFCQCCAQTQREIKSTDSTSPPCIEFSLFLSVPISGFLQGCAALLFFIFSHLIMVWPWARHVTSGRGGSPFPYILTLRLSLVSDHSTYKGQDCRSDGGDIVPHQLELHFCGSS